jgi:hypothetical protein
MMSKSVPLSIRRATPFLIAGIFALFTFGYALAQEGEPLSLSLRRDFGYSSGTGQIQGSFTARVTGPEDLARVIFLIDGDEMGEVTQPPFDLKFQTGNFPLGTHTLVAVGYTAGGEELRSNEQRREFVPAEEGWKTAGRIAIPIFAIVFLLMLFSVVFPMVTGRGKKSSVPLGEPRSYGMIGGTICPKCGRPFGMHIWGFNLIGGKLDRCPHCGRWSMVRHVSAHDLKQAEAAELLQAETPAQPTSSEQDLRKELDESRYQDF